GQAAAPATSVMNWRRLMPSMGSSPEPAVPAYRRLRMLRKHPQVLGTDLNRSDSEPSLTYAHFIDVCEPVGQARFRSGTTPIHAPFPASCGACACAARCACNFAIALRASTLRRTPLV